MCMCVCVCVYIYIFVKQCVKARAIPCPHQSTTRGDNTFSVAPGGTATPGTTMQLLPPDRVLRELSLSLSLSIYIYIYIYIYTQEQLRPETTLYVKPYF